MPLALFPLQKPLFPGIPLSLQIFEQRYLSLVSESLKAEKPFGVVPILTGREVGAAPDIFSWGTLVRIRDWWQLDNGLLGIVVRGERRIHVLETRVRQDGLVTADVEVCPRDEVIPVGECFADLSNLLADLAGHLKAAHLMPRGDLDAASLGWRLLEVLPIDTHKRISLLTLSDPVERLRRIRTWLLEIGQK